MSGTPTEAEVQSQWQKAIDILETTRNFADGTLAGASGKFDTLFQALEGEYLPQALTQFVTAYRSAMSAAVDPSQAATILGPVLLEYAPLIGFGGGYRDAELLARALYEHFNDNGYTVQSRAITYDTSATAGGSNVGNGAMSRLTTDENGYNLEGCHVETKIFRCRQDQNTGADENAELFEVIGEASSRDALLYGSYGSGDTANATIRSLHAGTGTGGSLLRNSSFQTYSASASPKFAGWDESAGGANIQQNTSAHYRTIPNSTDTHSLQITGGAGTVTIKQTLDSARRSRLDPDTPYFLRLMYNRETGSGDGTLSLKIGQSTATSVALSAQTGWNELVIPAGSACWLRNSNEDPFDIEITLASSTTGYVLIDDVIFAPWTLIDGTYWALRGNAASHTPWLLDDTLTFTDTGGAAGTGKLQWWWWRAGLGYLPSAGTPTVADP